MKKVVAIIQARMGSTRLPGKVMLPILEQPMIFHVVSRVKEAKLVNEVWLATTDHKNDDVISKWAETNNIKCYRGRESDVLDRYYQTALVSGADIIVRITSDCPLIDPEVIDQVIEYYLKTGSDYASTGRLKSKFPDGLDTEAFSFDVLKTAWQEAKLPSEREHVTSFIWQRPDRFKIGLIDCEKDLSRIRLTVDNQQDSDFVSLMFTEARNKKISLRLKSIVSLLEANPRWLSLNQDTQRNEGYYKSVMDDNTNL